MATKETRVRTLRFGGTVTKRWGGNAVAKQQPTLFDFLDDEDQKPNRLLSPDELFDKLDESLIKDVKENRYIERKTASFSGSSLGEYICMWANTQPDGGGDRTRRYGQGGNRRMHEVVTGAGE
jgi:hypothetical protein